MQLNWIFLFLKSRNESNAVDKHIIKKNNLIFHFLIWQMCGIPYIYAAGTKKK